MALLLKHNTVLFFLIRNSKILLILKGSTNDQLFMYACACMFL